MTQAKSSSQQLTKRDVREIHTSEASRQRDAAVAHLLKERAGAATVVKIEVMLAILGGA